MNHAELVAAIHAEVQQDRALSKADVAAVLDRLGKVAAEQLAGGNEVSLNGLGKLSIKQRAARTGRNPKTGEPIQIAAKTVVNFSASKALRDAVEA